MEETTELSISAFAKACGLTPSALRFYDDCGVLRPARVDPGNGYRYYQPQQQRRAILLRKLRDAGVGLAEIGEVLDGSGQRAQHVLRTHLRTMRQRQRSAQDVIEELLADFGDPATECKLGGAEFASAARQVVPAAAAREGYPALGCVLIELLEQEVRLVATDRYRLSMRVLKPTSTTGSGAELLVAAADLERLGQWAARTAEIKIVADGDGTARVTAGGESQALPLTNEAFPDYRTILQATGTPGSRVIVDRRALCEALATGVQQVVLTVLDGHLTIAGESGDQTLSAIVQGSPPRTAFDPAVLSPAIEASVGPDILLEITEPHSAVVVRSADQGSFTTFVMPRKELTA